MAAPVFFLLFDDVVGEFKSTGKVLVYQLIFEGVIQHEVEHGFDPGFRAGGGMDFLACVFTSVLNDVAVLHDALDMPCTKVLDTHTVENVAVPPGGGYCPGRGFTFEGREVRLSPFLVKLRKREIAVLDVIRICSILSQCLQSLFFGFEGSYRYTVLSSFPCFLIGGPAESDTGQIRLTPVPG